MNELAIHCQRLRLSNLHGADEVGTQCIEICRLYWSASFWERRRLPRASREALHSFCVSGVQVLRSKGWTEYERTALATVADTGRVEESERLRLGALIALSSAPLCYREATFLVEVIANARRGRSIGGWEDALDRLATFVREFPQYGAALESQLALLAPVKLVDPEGDGVSLESR